MSPSSVEVTYQPKGAGKKPRHAVFDLSVIADPETWLTTRVGPLAAYAAIPTAAPTKVASDVTASRTLSDLSLRLTSSMADILRARRAALAALIGLGPDLRQRLRCKHPGLKTPVNNCANPFPSPSGLRPARSAA